MIALSFISPAVRQLEQPFGLIKRQQFPPLVKEMLHRGGVRTASGQRRLYRRSQPAVASLFGQPQEIDHLPGGLGKFFCLLIIPAVIVALAIIDPGTVKATFTGLVKLALRKCRESRPVYLRDHRCWTGCAMVTATRNHASWCTCAAPAARRPQAIAPDIATICALAARG